MPNRILRESICTSETLMELTEAEESFFYRLIVQCDDFGRLDARTAVVRSKCYPLDPSRVDMGEVERRLDRLAQVGLIQLYTHEGKPYLHLVTWDKYQKRRAQHSKYPAPPNTCERMQTDADNSKQVPADADNCEHAQDTTPLAAVSICEHMSAHVPEKREARNEKRSRQREGASDNAMAAVVALWEENKPGTIGKYTLDKLAAWIEDDGVEPGLIIFAIERAIAASALRLDYVEKVLSNLEQEGITTRKAAEEKQRQRGSADGAAKEYRPLKVHR